MPSTNSGINWSDILKVAVPAGAAVGGAVIASRGANSAAKTQAQSATDALALQRDIFNKEQQNLAPYLNAGSLGLRQLLRGLGIGSGSANPVNPTGAPNASTSSMYSSPLLGQLRAKAPGHTTASRALQFGAAGAGIGGEFGGPLGAAIGGGAGALAGTVSGLFGQGRRQANALVPLQNQVSGEVDRITKAVDTARQNGTLTQSGLQEAINTVQGLQSEFGSEAQDFNKAGAGGVATLHQYFDPMLQQWQGELGNLPQSQNSDTIDMQAQPDGSFASGQDSGMGFGDLSKSFDFTKDPRYNAQFEATNHPFSMADFQADPGAEFRMAEGQKGVERSGSAKGMTLSGAGLKALERYRQDFASNEFSKAYDRFTNERAYGTGEYQRAFDRFNTEQGNKFNKLATVAGIGQTANGQNNSAGANFGANASDLITGQGNAIAAGQAGGAAALGGALANIGNQTSQYLTLRDLLSGRSRQSGYSNGWQSLMPEADNG